MNFRNVGIALILLAVLVVLYLLGTSTEEQRSEPAMSAMEIPQTETAGLVEMAKRMQSLGYLGETAAQPAPAAAPGMPPLAGNVAHAAVAEAVQDRYLLKNATISMETADARETAASISTTVAALGGYVGDLSEMQAAFGTTNARLVLRVPAGRLEETLTALEAMGKVLQKSVTSQDITEEYVDTEARLNNLHRTEERLLDHLGRTAKLEDILMAEQEITRVREQIERLEGRMRFLKDRVAFSTVNVHLQEAPGPEPVLPADTFSMGQVFTQAFRSVVALFQGVLVAVIWGGVWAMVWGPLALLAWILVRSWRRRKV
jgi:hypothetical protein